MLLPALNKAREKAKAIHCTSNLKQMGNAVLFYTDANNGFMAPPIDIGDRDIWTNMLIKSGEFPGMTKDDVASWKAKEGKQNTSVLLCPSLSPTILVSLQQTYGIIYHGDWGLYRFGGKIELRQFNGTTMSQKGSPAATPIIMDSIKGTLQSYTIDNYWQSGFIHARHNNFANMLFSDGHVEAVETGRLKSISPFFTITYYYSPNQMKLATP